MEDLTAKSEAPVTAPNLASSGQLCRCSNTGVHYVCAGEITNMNVQYEWTRKYETVSLLSMYDNDNAANLKRHVLQTLMMKFSYMLALCFAAFPCV